MIPFLFLFSHFCEKICRFGNARTERDILRFGHKIDQHKKYRATYFTHSCNSSIEIFCIRANLQILKWKSTTFKPHTARNTQQSNTKHTKRTQKKNIWEREFSFFIHLKYKTKMIQDEEILRNGVRKKEKKYEENEATLKRWKYRKEIVSNVNSKMEKGKF